MHRLHPRLVIVRFLLLAGSVLSCSDVASSLLQTESPGEAVRPGIPAKPVIMLSADSIVTSAVVGAAVADHEVRITPGDTTKLRELTLGTGGFGDGDAGDWLSARLDSANAPASMVVRVDPARAVVGSHMGAITVGARGADSKTVRVRLNVRARPILLLDSAIRSISASLGDSIPAATVTLRSSTDTIGQLSLTPPECGGGSWLTATLSQKTTPAAVTLAVDPRGLGAGSFECRVNVQSSQALVDSASRTIVVSLTLKQAPRIAIDLAGGARFLAISGGDASPLMAPITNGGSGILDRLSVGPIDYGAGAPSGWLSASLDRTVAPAVLTLSASARTLNEGTYTATVPVRSAATGVMNGEVSVPVMIVVSARSFRLVISPTVVTVTYSHTTGKGTSAAISFFDGNASGRIASIAQLRGSPPVPGTGSCPPYIMSGSLDAAPKLPQSYNFSVGYNNDLTRPPPGSCSWSFVLTLDNGQSGSFTVNTSVTP